MKHVHLLLCTTLFMSTTTFAQTTPGSMSMPMNATTAGAKSSTVMTDAVVQNIDLAHGKVLLKHGDITNLGMPAMTMNFPVADRKMLDGYTPGDRVRFHAELMDGKATVTKLEAVR